MELITKNIILQSRDKEIIRFIEEQGFVTFQQLQTLFFKSVSSCANRLKDLIDSKYITRKSVADMLCIKKQGSIYFPHLLNLGLKASHNLYYLNRNFARGYGKSGKLFKKSMILHQLILGDVRIFLQNEIKHRYILNDPLITLIADIHGIRQKHLIPDLTIEFADVKIAVEVEKTLKYDGAYHERIFHYNQSVYSHVLYFYTNESILRKLMKKAGMYAKFGYAHYANPNQIFSPRWGLLDINEFLHKVKIDH